MFVLASHLEDLRNEAKKAGATVTAAAIQEFSQMTGINGTTMLTQFPPRNISVQLANGTTQNIRDYMPLMRVCAAHVLKNVAKRMFQVLRGDRTVAAPKKTKNDTQETFRVKVLRQRNLVEQYKGLRLKQDEQDLADRIIRSILGPANFIRRGARPFQWLGDMTINDWGCVVLTDVGKVVLAFLPNLQDRPQLAKFFDMYCHLSDACQLLYKAPIRVRDVKDQLNLKNKMSNALVMYSEVMPATEHSITPHTLLEVVRCACEDGPVTHNLGAERWLHGTAQRAHDRHNPEVAIVNTLIMEAATRNTGVIFKDEITQGWDTPEEKKLMASLLPDSRLAEEELISFSGSQKHTRRLNARQRRTIKAISAMDVTDAVFFSSPVKILGDLYRFAQGQKANAKSMHHICRWGKTKVAIIQEWCQIPDTDQSQLLAMVKLASLQICEDVKAPFIVSEGDPQLVSAARLGTRVAMKTFGMRTFIFDTVTYRHPRWGGDDAKPFE